ncbi:MAG: hypothetical protein ACT4O1_05225 [Gemmatimonadota bacterium]
MSAHYIVRRFGFRPTRGWVALSIIVALLAAGSFWIGPFRPRPPELKLLALSGDGRFREFVGIPSAWADTLSPASEATARFPLILAVHNAGSRVARPTELALSLPSRFRVTDSRGVPLPSSTVIGNPLVRYELPIETGAIEPGQLPTMIAGGDTLWLEAIVPSIYCTALSDSVPEFVSAPPQNPNLMARVRIFYSFSGGTRQRQTGLLTVQVDPNLVERAPAPRPPIFETQVIEPEAPRPPLSALIQIGSRITWCGDPGQPVEIHSALWETPEGGRFIVLYHGGVPRKHLFDLNRDSIIELEMWDQDGDGKFESRRVARMAIPAFLMPYPKPEAAIALVDPTLMQLDSMANTPAWLRIFFDINAGPLRFSTRARPAPAPATAPAPAPAPATATAPATAEWLGLFHNSAAGPLRFYRAQRGEEIPLPPRPQPRPQPEGPKLLGVPVDSIRR